MSFSRFAGLALLALSFFIDPLRAAQTAATPGANPGSPGLVPTAAVTPAAPTTPAAPSTAVPSAAVPIAPANPLAPAPAPPSTAATPAEPHAALPQGTPLPAGSEPEKSVVQIITTYQEPNWAAPWIFDTPHFASGTGFLIDGNRIMTNAHVVAWTKELRVRNTTTRSFISPRSSTWRTTSTSRS